MTLATYEAVVENGRIVLPDDIQLPERTRVYVVVPEGDERRPFQMASPRRRHPEQATDYVKKETEEPSDPGV